MRTDKLRFGKILPIVGLAFGLQAQAAVDPNFYVFLAFGQSNMEGQAPMSAADQVANPRFKNMSAVTCSGRTQGAWTAAVAPIVRCNTKLSPLDHFGRTLVDSLPSNITIGVAPLAVAGSKIEGFDESTYSTYYATQQPWMTNIVSQYGGNPYARLVSLGKEAQKTGVIKGILLHQGESNTGDAQWATKVNKIYQSLLTDLGLKASDVPLLAGEVAPTGVSAGANSMIDALPKTIQTAYVISSKGLTIDNSDGQNVHFDAASYRTLGKRYAEQMLKLLKTSSVAPSSRMDANSVAGDYAVYDLKGTRVASFHAENASMADAQWAKIRQTIPGGIYWLKNAKTESARSVFSGR